MAIIEKDVYKKVLQKARWALPRSSFIYNYFSQKSLGSRYACACSEAGFSCQNDHCAPGVCYRTAKFCCAFFRVQKDSKQRIFIKKYFLFTVGSVCRVKRFITVSRNASNVSLMMKRLKRRRRNG
jgi:hypothetical protein